MLLLRGLYRSHAGAFVPAVACVGWHFCNWYVHDVDFFSAIIGTVFAGDFDVF